MHHAVDVQALDCDFTSSGHKLYGPTGIGVLYVKDDILQAMPPWKGRLDDRHRQPVGRDHLRARAVAFEAGTPNTGGIIGLGAAFSYVSPLALRPSVSMSRC